MTPDYALLRQFADTNSEAAFNELVRRHVNLVYSAALRQVNGDEHLAKDVAQAVFTDLARKADSLARRESLTGWLYTSAHFAAAKMVRGENRRRDREEKFMREPIETAPEADWEKLRPTLDDAMHELKEADREAILLRYFENQPFIQVGAKLGLNENAARMRVERALEKLRGIFTKRGITTAAALAYVISANAVQMAPANLAAKLTTASIAAAGTGTFTLLKIMTATKLKLAFSALVVAGATTAFVIQHQVQEKLSTDNATLTQQIAQLQTDNESLSNRLIGIVSSKSFSDEQMNELLKLRGEVTRLKKENEDAILAANEARDAEGQALLTLANVPPVKTFVQTTRANISWNEVLVSGGWKTPSGKRALIFTTVKPDQEANQMTIQSKVLEFTDDAADKLGLSQFQVDDQPQSMLKSNKLTVEQYEAISKASQNIDGVEIIAAPAVSLTSGRTAQVQSTEVRSLPSGEKYFTGPVIDLIPAISEDGQSVSMVMVAQVNFSTKPETN
jgi:RNA polymerase sigma factor (sigma-70 family)